MKKINDLIDIDYNIEVNGITDDSRLVKNNYIYVATKGYNVDHYDYINDAIKRGCVFVVVDRKIEYDIPHIIVENIDEYYKYLCMKFYDIDLNNYKFIGVTGTDGKTSTATIIHKLIDSSAYIGTNGLSFDDKYFFTNNTTPCIPELYGSLHKIKTKNIDNVVMEISSEALLHNRVSNFKFDCVIFTNVTVDHLNVHKKYQNYFNCKMKLLNYLNEDAFIVVNGDDNNLKRIMGENIVKVGFDKSNDYVIENVNMMTKYVKFTIRSYNKIYKLKSFLKGKFNIYNISLAFVACLLYGIDDTLLCKKIENIKFISGRCELLYFGQNFDIVLDYAHTINGIRNILETFNNYKKVIVVTGCAGGRDVSKRKIIGKYIMDNCDVAIFTMDDPRNEDVNKIIDDMIGEETNYFRIIDRKEAINYALSIADVGSVVLILGKGRDNYMAIDDEKIDYSDYEVVQNFFK